MVKCKAAGHLKKTINSWGPSWPGEGFNAYAGSRLGMDESAPRQYDADVGRSARYSEEYHVPGAWSGDPDPFRLLCLDRPGKVRRVPVDAGQRVELDSGVGVYHQNQTPAVYARPVPASVEVWDAEVIGNHRNRPGVVCGVKLSFGNGSVRKSSSKLRVASMVCAS